MDDTFKQFLETPLRTEEAKAYRQAESLSDLHFEAGRQVARHGLSMLRALGVRWHGSFWLAVVKVLAGKRWEAYVGSRLRALVACFAADLAAFKELMAPRWRRAPLVSFQIRKILSAACFHAAERLRLNEAETEILLDGAARALSPLLDHLEWTREDIVSNLLDIMEIRDSSTLPNPAAFVGSAMLEGTGIDIVEFLKALKRIAP